MVAKAWEGVGSVLNCLLQDIVEKTFAGVGVRSPFRTERRSLLYLSHGGKKRAIQLSCAGSLHLGFDNEHVALFHCRHRAAQRIGGKLVHLVRTARRGELAGKLDGHNYLLDPAAAAA